MPVMTPIRSLWFPVKAFTDVVGTFGPPPTGSVVANFLTNPEMPGAAEPVTMVRLGVYVGSEEQLQSILPFFWDRLRALLERGGYNPTQLGQSPPWNSRTRFGDIAVHVFSRYNPQRDGAEALGLEDAADALVLPAHPSQLGDEYPEHASGDVEPAARNGR